jgi:hypothetical protein
MDIWKKSELTRVDETTILWNNELTKLQVGEKASWQNATGPFLFTQLQIDLAFDD